MQKKDLEIFVGYPRFEKIIRIMRECHNTYGDSRPSCALITASAGVGKTTLIDEYLHRYDSPRERVGNNMIVPILSIRAPGSASSKSLLSRMLHILGDRAWSKGSKDSMAERLISFIGECKVTLIMIQETQHLVDSDSKKVITKTRDTLKDLLDSTSTPIILFGMPKASDVVDEDQQVQDRFSVRLKLVPFGYDDEIQEGEDEAQAESRKKEFQHFLWGVERQLPFEQPFGLDSEDMSYRLFYASDGNPRRLVEELIKNAALYAINSGRKGLDIKDLALAFETYLHGIVPHKTNPFKHKVFNMTIAQRYATAPAKLITGGINERTQSSPRQDRPSDYF